MKPITKGTVALAAVAAGIGLAGTAYACGWGWWSPTADQIVTPADLTAAQQKKVATIQEDYARRLKPLEDRLRKKQAEFQTYVASGNATTAGIKLRRGEIRKLTGQIEDLRLDAEGAVRKVAPDRGAFTYRGAGSRHWHGSYGCDWSPCDWTWRAPSAHSTPGNVGGGRTWSSSGGCCW